MAFEPVNPQDEDEIVDLFSDAISDSFDEEWTARMGAKSVVGAISYNGLSLVRTVEIEALRSAVLAVVHATRAYLPPDGIDAQECLNRILGATDSDTINPFIAAAEKHPA